MKFRMTEMSDHLNVILEVDYFVRKYYISMVGNLSEMSEDSDSD